MEENFFHIYDSKKLIAGYFDPDYGNIYSKEDCEDIISSMLKNHDKILGGLVMVPLVKFGLFDTDLNTSIFAVEQNIVRVTGHLQKWKNFLSETGRNTHSVSISHTDQDMLTITFPMKFPKPTMLEETKLLKEISPTFDLLQRSDLL